MLSTESGHANHLGVWNRRAAPIDHFFRLLFGEFDTPLTRWQHLVAFDQPLTNDLSGTNAGRLL